MNITATRDEATPTTTVLNAMFGKNKTPEQLVDEALAAFTGAEKKLTAAFVEVERQEADLVAKQQELQTKLDKAAEAKGRLGRIRQRITDLMA